MTCLPVGTGVGEGVGVYVGVGVGVDVGVGVAVGVNVSVGVEVGVANNPAITLQDDMERLITMSKVMKMSKATVLRILVFMIFSFRTLFLSQGAYHYGDCCVLLLPVFFA
jgi:hypothetical protein